MYQKSSEALTTGTCDEEFCSDDCKSREMQKNPGGDELHSRKQIQHNREKGIFCEGFPAFYINMFFSISKKA